MMNNFKEIKNIIEELFNVLSIEVKQISIVTDHELSINIIDIQTPEQGLFLYNNGELLKAINHLSRKQIEVMYRKSDLLMVDMPQYTVDVNQVQARHLAELKSKSRLAADRAKDQSKPQELEPMTSYDRLIVHTFLQKDPQITTESVGEDFERRVIVKLV